MTTGSEEDTGQLSICAVEFASLDHSLYWRSYDPVVTRIKHCYCLRETLGKTAKLYMCREARSAHELMYWTDTSTLVYRE